MFDLRLDAVSSWVKERSYGRVALQMPEGLKVRATVAADLIRSQTGAEVIVLGDPCYGACDIHKGFRAYADALVHFGHSPIPSLGVDDDVLFVEVRVESDIDLLVDEAATLIDGCIGLVATVQYLDLIPKAVERLEAVGRQVIVGLGDDRIQHPGQVLGCNHSAASAVEDSVDGFIFIGEGNFHPLAVALSTDLPVVVVDPLMGGVRSVGDLRDAMLRQRFAAIARAMDAQRFLVVVSSKPGQRRRALAEEVIGMIRSNGRQGHIVVLDEVTPDALLPYAADAAVITACPRIALDDRARYNITLLTHLELRIALGEVEWKDYVFDQITLTD